MIYKILPKKRGILWFKKKPQVYAFSNLYCMNMTYSSFNYWEVLECFSFFNYIKIFSSFRTVFGWWPRKISSAKVSRPSCLSTFTVLYCTVLYYTVLYCTHLLVSVLPNAVVSNVDDVRVVVVGGGDCDPGGPLQLAPVTVDHRVLAPVRVKHLQNSI